MATENNASAFYLEARTCKECGVSYTIEQFYQSSESYFDPPYRYSDSCEDYCLACWLGVGPNDFPPMEYGDSDATEFAYPPTKGYSPGAGRDCAAPG